LGRTPVSPQGRLPARDRRIGPGLSVPGVLFHPDGSARRSAESPPCGKLTAAKAATASSDRPQAAGAQCRPPPCRFRPTASRPFSSFSHPHSSVEIRFLYVYTAGCGKVCADTRRLEAGGCRRQGRDIPNTSKACPERSREEIRTAAAGRPASRERNRSAHLSSCPSPPRRTTIRSVETPVAAL